MTASALTRTVAAVFLRKGVDSVTVTEFKHALSLDLRWFTPAEARRVLMHAADVGLLRMDGERAVATFRAADVDVPVDFRPTMGVLDERPEVPAARGGGESGSEGAGEPGSKGAGEEPDEPLPLVDRILREAAVTAGEDASEVRLAFEHEKARVGDRLSADVVALVVARRRGVDVAEDAAGLLDERAA